MEPMELRANPLDTAAFVCLVRLMMAGAIELDDDGRIDFLIADHSIRLFTSDPLDGENFVADIVSALKKFKFLLREDKFEEILDDDDGFTVIPSEPPGLGFRLSTLIVINLDNTNGIDETPSEPSGLGSHVSTSVHNGVMIGLDDDDGIAMIPSEPPGLGSRISTSIVIELVDGNSVDDTLSKPLGLGFRASISMDDGVIELDDDNAVIDVLLFDDDAPILASRLSIPRDNGAIDLLVDDDSTGLGTRLSTAIDDGVIELDDEDGIDGIIDLYEEGGIDVIPSEPAEAGYRLSTSIVIDLDDEEDGIDGTPSEPPGLGSPPVSTSSDNGSVIDLDDIPSDPFGLGSRLSTSIVIETWSEPPGLGSIAREHRLSPSIVIDLDDDYGIAGAIPSEPPGHGSPLSSSIDGIGTAPGEQYKKIRVFQTPRANEDRALACLLRLMMVSGHNS